VIRVVYSEGALRDLERFVEFSAQEEASPEAIDLIAEAVEALARHPHLGRPVRGTLRELVISFGRTGYVALYRLVPGRVEVLALRHQREGGYRLA
jgi:plasmid stabilization system protein ParE